ncbi:MAG: transcriptional regulator [Boseongicola sp. SB0676_bin_33]|nr:transcriptional regulator [Boseongicola sp. SB0676_bin_33]
MSFWEYANPRKFMATTDRLVGPLFLLAALCLGTGLAWGFFFAPDDFRQGSTVRIIYLHVPSAMMAINAWSLLRGASFIGVAPSHHVAPLAPTPPAPVGLAMTLMALFTGAVWGQPMWGSWWEWDPRLTSFLILFLFYLGYIALWSSVENPDTAADLTSMLCVVGSVFALLSRYAVNFWSQGLHQAASLSLDSDEHISNEFWLPLVVSIAGFVILFVALVLLRTRCEIRLRRVRALELKERVS